MAARLAVGVKVGLLVGVTVRVDVAVGLRVGVLVLVGVSVGVGVDDGTAQAILATVGVSAGFWAACNSTIWNDKSNSEASVSANAPTKASHATTSGRDEKRAIGNLGFRLRRALLPV